jgi:hypothetical protein
MSTTLTNFLTDPTVHNALLSTMAVTALITALPSTETVRNCRWKDLPFLLYKYVYDALHTFMSLKTGAQLPAPPPQQPPQLPQLPSPPTPTLPAPSVPEFQPSTK